MEKIFKQRKPKFLWTDKGKEFYNKQVEDLLNKNNIKLYSTHNYEIKNPVIKHLNKTHLIKHIKTCCIKDLLKTITQYSIISLMILGR